MRCPFLGRVMTALFPNVGFVSKSRRTHWVVNRPARMRTVEKRETFGCPFGESSRESCIPLLRTRSKAATILFTGGVLFRRRRGGAAVPNKNIHLCFFSDFFLKKVHQSSKIAFASPFSNRIQLISKQNTLISQSCAKFPPGFLMSMVSRTEFAREALMDPVG
jgi:hypothetical protein